MKFPKINQLALLIVLSGLLMTLTQCNKVFRSVNPIVSNDYIKHRIRINLRDANPTASNPYVISPTVTMAGDGITRSLVYSDDGKLITGAPGSAVVSNGVVSVVIRPYTTIAANQPVKFSILVEAPGYSPRTMDINVRSIDSLSYYDVFMTRNSAPAPGVSRSTGTVGVNAGTTTGPLVMTLTPPGTGQQVSSRVTVPSNTIMRDANNNVINSSAALIINITHFPNTSSGSVLSVPGGLSNVTTSTGSVVTMLLGGSMDISAFIGNTEIKSFSQPWPATMYLNPNTFNPRTGAVIKSGDNIDIWSRDKGFARWTPESTATITTEAGTGRLKVDFNVTHLSEWAAVFPTSLCNNTLTLNYSSNNNSVNTHLLTVSTQGTGGQILDYRIIQAQKGDIITVPNLPTAVPVTIRLYDGVTETSPLISSVNAGACATSANLTYALPASRPTLFFDLQTQCTDGLFRYTGPIEFKKATETVWAPFTPSTNGTLTTELLDWGVTYDFRILYRNVLYLRRRTVNQSEFRAYPSPAVNHFYYWGTDPNTQRTFFSAPTACN